VLNALRHPSWPQPHGLYAAREHNKREVEGNRRAYRHGQWAEAGLVNPVCEVMTVRFTPQGPLHKDLDEL